MQRGEIEVHIRFGRISIVPIALLLSVSLLGFADHALGNDVQARSPVQREFRIAGRSPESGMTPVVLGVPLDTVFIGYSPGHEAPDNYWSIGSGVSLRRPPQRGGMWDFSSTVQGDSAQGWWPARMRYVVSSGSGPADWQRPWWSLDIGNLANYRGIGGTGRTLGVVGVWHRDGGMNAAPAPPAGLPKPTWTPIQGQYSAWMGLRAHGDQTVVDPLTGNAFNEDVLNLTSQTSITGAMTSRRFPGYGSQMDQMLYRDIPVDTSTTLTVDYSYKTEMSMLFATSAAFRTGWFDKDPLTPTGGGGTQNPASIGNFRSSTSDGASAVRDSFMVYLGAPVEAVFTGSDGVSHAVYDPLRRWFSEVLRIDGYQVGPPPYVELESVAGNKPTTARSVTLLAATVKRIAAGTGRVRLVFRVKTNRGFDDQGVPDSLSGAGAALVDAVSYRVGTGPPVVIGDFESPGSINNADGSALTSWKSTGKPPSLQFHLHDLSTLNCGGSPCNSLGSPLPGCDMAGGVLSAGNHDDQEYSSSGVPYSVDRERVETVVSPSICLKTPPTGLNPIGLSATDFQDLQSIGVSYQIYTGDFDVFTEGSSWRIGLQCYPVKTSDLSYETWSDPIFPGYDIFTPDDVCFEDFVNATDEGLIRTSNPTGIPDSIRIVLSRNTRMFAYGIQSPVNQGAYFPGGHPNSSTCGHPKLLHLS